MGSRAVRILAARDVNVLAVDRDEENLRRLAAELPPGPADVRTCVADVSRKDEVARYVDTAAGWWGGVDGAFHAAGWEGAMREFLHVDIDEFDRMIEVNARSVWYGMRFVLPLMLARGGGRIVNTGSYVAFHGTLRTAAYGAAKHAVVGMSRGVALEFAARGVSVNVLAPGAMDTRMIRTVWERNAPGDPERGRAMTAARVPTGRICDPEEVAAVGVWLLTAAPANLTGQIIPVDGGSSI